MPEGLSPEARDLQEAEQERDRIKESVDFMKSETDQVAEDVKAGKASKADLEQHFDATAPLHDQHDRAQDRVELARDAVEKANQKATEGEDQDKAA